MNINDILKTKLNIIDRDCEALLANDIQKIYSAISPHISKNILPQLKAFQPTVLRSITRKNQIFTKEMCRILKESNQKIKQQNIDFINTIIDEKFGVEKYRNRNDAFLGSVERLFSGYGLVFNQKSYRTDLIKSCYSCAIQNHTRKIRAGIISELHLLVLAQEDQQGLISTANKIVDIKPNFFGIGLNLNKVIDKFTKKNHNN